MSRSVIQPIPYQGSKRHIAATLLTYFPPHIFRLVEPFSGSAAVALAVAVKHHTTRFWLNDANTPLMQLWEDILNHPEELADQYAALWHGQLGREREYFCAVRQRFNRTHVPADFLYLLARCVKAAVRYNAQGEFNNTPDHRRKGARPHVMRQRLMGASSLLRGRTRVSSWDYTEVLHACTPDDFVYLDPPYQGVCGNRDGRYLGRIDHDVFCEELRKLIEREIQFAVSYDGRTGEKTYGKPLPPSLGLACLEISAGRSSQATLLGRVDSTYESLYLSPALQRTLRHHPARLGSQEVMWQ